MGHCKDCQHWELENIDNSDGQALCRKIEKASTFVTLASGESVDFWTSPAFGCVLFNAR